MATGVTPQWKKDLRPASFRGVAFYINSSDYEGGRRGVTHEFAQREKPFGEDTGRRARKFSLDAYVLGPNYMKDRDALLAALETAGPGVLIHPYFGRQVVNCFEGVKIRESTREGGMAVFSIPFVEHGEELYPDVTVDPSFLTNAAANAVVAAAKSNFDSVFSVLGLPGAALNDATARINSFTSQITSISNSISAQSPAIADFALAMRKLKSASINLIHTPSNLSAQVANNISLLTQAFAVPGDIYNAMAQAFGFQAKSDVKTPPVPTPSVQRTQANAYVFDHLVRAIAVAEATRVAADVNYVSTADALKFRNKILDAADDLMQTANDDLYQSLQELKKTAVAALPAQDQSLATIVQVKNKVDLPSLVVAYKIYGDVSLESDLIARNDIRNPAFVPAGVDLEVLENEPA